MKQWSVACGMAGLADTYAALLSDAEKRQRKAVIFQDLKDQYQQLKVRWGGYAGYDRWFAEPLSNAHLASVATYHDLVPGFRALLAQEKSFDKFYAAVKDLAALDMAPRQRQLAALATPPMADSPTLPLWSAADQTPGAAKSQ